MKKEFRLIWTEHPKVKYFVGFGVKGTIFLEDSSNAFKYNTQEHATFGRTQVRQIMIVNEKYPPQIVDLYLSIEEVGGKSKQNNTDKAYKKAMDII